MKLTRTFFDDIRGLISTARATVARGAISASISNSRITGSRIGFQLHATHFFQFSNHWLEN